MRLPSVPPARGEAEEAVFPYTRGLPAQRARYTASFKRSFPTRGGSPDRSLTGFDNLWGLSLHEGAPPSLVGKGAGGLGKSPARTYGLRLCGESFHRRN